VSRNSRNRSFEFERNLNQACEPENCRDSIAVPVLAVFRRFSTLMHPPLRLRPFLFCCFWICICLMVAPGVILAQQVAVQPSALPTPTPTPAPAQQDQKDGVVHSDRPDSDSGSSTRPLQNSNSDKQLGTGLRNGEEDSAHGPGAPGSAAEPDIEADHQEKRGDTEVYDGYVNARMGKLHLQSDTLTYNKVTGDLVAQGNVIYDQEDGQRITAHRAEINNLTHRGTFWETTGFTNRTETGEYLFFTAERVIKTGPDTYELYNATITACEDTTPKWSFTSKRADMRIDDKVKLYNAVFRVHGIPALVFPVMWLPTTKDERKSGFLIPAPGNSNQKGRTLTESYFQTLGKSADITLSTYYYSLRGLGVGSYFRAQTDDNSFVRFSFFSVKDRLFGPAGPDQGGTSINGYGVQYLPDGWLAAGSLSITSSLAFRQVFSDSLSQVINPTQDTIGYLTKNAPGYSINFMAENETTTLFRPSQLQASKGDDFDVTLRHLPEADITGYDKAIWPNLPIYFSFDSSFGAVSRLEAFDGPTIGISNTKVLFTPTIGRFDLAPTITAPLPEFGGIQITPSLTLRDTYYTGSQNPNAPFFNPDYDALPGNPKLTPGGPGFVPALQEFVPGSSDRLLGGSINRHYGELDVDVRLPALAKDYRKDDPAHAFRHVIETYMTYRLISGIGGEFNNIVLFDDRDAVANANMLEYGVINRFYLTRHPTEIIRRHRRQASWHLLGMQPEKPVGRSEKGTDTDISCVDCAGASGNKAEGVVTPPPVPSGGQPTDKTPAGQPAPAGSEAAGQTAAGNQNKPGAKPVSDKLETGTQVALITDVLGPYIQSRSANQRPSRKYHLVEGVEEEDTSDEIEPVQPYEFLTVKVAQQYFFNRDFGGALTSNGLGQFFYPLNTLSGFTFGGVPRSFSPVNLAIYYRPLSFLYTDLRMDLGTTNGSLVRDVTLSGGILRDYFAIQAGWFYTQRVEIAPNVFEPGTFNGNAVQVGFLVGNYRHGVYGGSKFGYDFTHEFVQVSTTQSASGLVTAANRFSTGRLTNSRNFVGYNWDCCGVQFNYSTFNVGLRNENQYSFTFYLGGLGNFGTDQVAQAASNNRKRRSGNSGVFFDEWP